MTKKKKYNYPLFKVHVDADSALPILEKVLRSGFINEGEQVTQFNDRISEYLDTEYAVVLNSCTSALTLALKLSGVTQGSEVISTSMTCVASNTPIHNVGGKIVWADIKRETGNLNIEDVRKKITPSTKAVLCVDWAGLPCELEELHTLCKEHNIKLIQDGAHAFGATYKNKQVCHFADFTCYSFQAIKHITCGDGGVLVCSNKEDCDEAKRLKWFGIDREATKDEKGEWKGQRWEVDIKRAGYKLHMNNIAAAIGLSQIEHIDNIISKHKTNATVYTKHLSSIDYIHPLKYAESSDPSFWIYTVLLNENINRDRVVEKLNAVGISAGLAHVPNHPYTCFKESYIELPETDYFSLHQVSLPCGWWLNEDDILNIIDELKIACNE